jgi:acetyltransferase
MASFVVNSSVSRTRSALESFFTPACVAVIGATEREGSVGQTILGNLVHSSYRGHVFAVNPKHSELLGTKCYPSVAALPEPVDLAVIVTPAVTVAGVVRECVDAGARSAIVISAGFKERGAEGVELEHLIQADTGRGNS